VLYLRVMALRCDAATEATLVTHAVRAPPFPVARGPERHPKGGWCVWVEATQDDHEVLTIWLQTYELALVV
jgi:hypothetical protein